MLIFFILIYFVLTLGIGFYANKKIKGGSDFINAGRNLHPILNAFALFALWFGSETLFGASSEFIEHGVQGIIEDPLGGVLCLLLVGLLYSKRMYRLNVLTIGDLFRKQYGVGIERIASLLMILAFLGYIAAQLLALGLVANVLLGISVPLGIFISAVLVVTYTVAGGMLAVSLTDFIQSIMILIGLSIVAIYLTYHSEGFDAILSSVPEHHWRLLPDANFVSTTNWFAAWMVLGLGSIVSQDIFQRVNAARSEKAAYSSSIAGALMYAVFSILPLYIIIALKSLHPDYINGNLQTVLPQFIHDKMPMAVKIIFFGSVLSAILSTASGAILAPASLFSENIIRTYTKNDTEKKLLLHTRLSIVGTTIIACFISLSSETIFDLVGQSSVFGLVSIFVPFTAALFFGHSNKAAAFLSMTLGPIIWAICEFLLVSEINPLIYGLMASIIGFVIGSFWKRY